MAVVLVYFPSLKIPFLFDDYQIYLDYWPAVSWPAFFHDVTHHFQQNRLLTHASWYVQMILNGPGLMRPAAFHWVNLALHAFNSVLVLALVRRLGASAATGALCAGLFAIHPCNLEAVSYLYGRSDLLVTTLLLWTLILIKDPPRRLGLAALCLAAAVLTKETAIVTPALYALIVGVLKPPAYRVQWTAIALVLAAALASVTGFIFLKTDHADNFGFAVPNAVNYLMLQPFCLMLGLVRMAAPAGFSIVYQFDLPAHVWDLRVAGPIVFWGVFLFLCIRQYRRNNPVYLFALGWYLATMAPTNSIIPRIDQISDRHLYLALIGPFWALSTAIEQAWTRHGAWIKILACLALVVFGTLTFTRNIRWQSATAVWAEALAKFPNSYLARRELAAEWGRAGDPVKELELLESVTKNWPDDWTSWNNLGIAYAAQNIREKEQHAYRQALARAPVRHQAMLHHNLAFSYQNDNRPDSAIESYRTTIALNPDSVGSKHNLAILLWQKGDVQEAERLLNEVLAANPHMETARENLRRMREFKLRSQTP